DMKGDITSRLPKAPARKNGKRVACIGAGPASLTVANDLLPLGYDVTLFEKHDRAGGLMWSNIPQFRLPPEVLDEDINAILDMGADLRLNSPVTSMDALLREGWDAVFIGSGAPRDKQPAAPALCDDRADVPIGIAGHASCARGPIARVGERVIVVGVGNAAMGCCRASLGHVAKDVKV